VPIVFVRLAKPALMAIVVGMAQEKEANNAIRPEANTLVRCPNKLKIAKTIALFPNARRRLGLRFKIYHLQNK